MEPRGTHFSHFWDNAPPPNQGEGQGEGNGPRARDVEFRADSSADRLGSRVTRLV